MSLAVGSSRLSAAAMGAAPTFPASDAATSGSRDLVVGAPTTLRSLAGALRAGGSELEAHAVRLGAASAAFGIGQPDFGRVATALADDIAARLVHESSVGVRAGEGVAMLADLLEVADRAGFGGLPTASAIGWDVVVIDAALLDTFAVGPADSIVALRDALRRRRNLLAAAQGDLHAFSSAPSVAAAGDLGRLDALVRQLDAIVVGRPFGWAGVGSETWETAGGFVAAAALGGAVALARRAEAGADIAGDFGANATWVAEHPFLTAAQRHGIAITPARLELLVEIDRLLGLPIDDFLDERERGLAGAPLLDWSSDACSGPVISTAEHHCYRHDFIYRNARMLRDQWGLPAGFAEDLKDMADHRLTWEVVDDTPYLPGRWDLYAWALGVGAAVSIFGTVATPWAPPDPRGGGGGGG